MWAALVFACGAAINLPFLPGYAAKIGWWNTIGLIATGANFVFLLNVIDAYASRRP